MRGRAEQGLFTLVHPPEQEGGAPVAALSCLWSQIAVRISPAADFRASATTPEAHGINQYPQHTDLQLRQHLCTLEGRWPGLLYRTNLQETPGSCHFRPSQRAPFNHSAPQSGEETGASAVVY